MMFSPLDIQTRSERVSHQLLSTFDGDQLLEDIMDTKGKEKGILKLDPRPRTIAESGSVLTPQASCERPPCSPQPSVDRLSVTWADPGSMTSTSVNLFHPSSEIPTNSDVKFSPSAGDGSDDEDYSASLSAVLRQRRASVRRSRKGRSRRPSSPFLPDESRTRRRSSVFTTSSGDTAISIDEQPGILTQEVIFENIHLHKEVLGSVKQQPLAMRKKLKIVHQAKTYVKKHEGQLQERLAQSKSTRDIYARFNIWLTTKWQQLKREAANTSNLLIPWELRIKEIESHFGSVVASYFTFLRWLFWVNLVIGIILLVFVIIPEYLTANPLHAGERKKILDEEIRNATNLLTLWEFDGVLKCSPIFYGYYSNIESSEYRMPLAYFLTGLAVYIYSFVAILRKMAENSRMSKLSEKEDECIFSWKLFTGWDFMIGNAETAHNRIASVILGFKEALLEEAEKKKNLRDYNIIKYTFTWRIISLRAIVNICVMVLLAISAYAVVTVVSRSDVNTEPLNWWRENETTIVVTVITITFPVFFELLGYLEHYHPRKQLRLQLARIMLLNLLNLYSLIFALFSKIEGMSTELTSLQPNLSTNAVMASKHNITENLYTSVPLTCLETTVPCLPHDMTTSTIMKEHLYSSKKDSTMLPILETSEPIKMSTKIDAINKKIQNRKARHMLTAENLVDKDLDNLDSLTTSSSTSYYSIVSKEMEKLRTISKINILKNTSLIDELSAINETVDENENASYDENEIAITDIYDDNEAADTTTFYSSSTSTFNIMHSSDTTEGNEPYSVTPTESTSQLHTTDTVYSDITFTDDPKANFTFIYSTNTNYLNSESISTKSSSINNTRSSSTDIDYMLTNEFSTSTQAYTPIEYTIKEMSSTIYDYIYPTEDLKNITNTQPHIPMHDTNICPNISFNCTMNCGKHNITQIFHMVNCTIVKVQFYVSGVGYTNLDAQNLKRNLTNVTLIDTVYYDNYKRKMYNLTLETKKKLLKLCWETMFGQELVKLTMMDLVFVLLGTLFLDFFRALFVRYMNRCWCWDLEKKCPEYGDFKIAENILHLINNQGMVWMGMFFSPGLVVLNVIKLMIMMYLRSWAVMTCNVPHEVVFRVSKSNNFYLALLLTMLFLCVLPVGYTIVWVKPSWHCGPFSEYDKIYSILTKNISEILPQSLNFALKYITSPAIVIPLLLLLILIIYYLTSLTNSLREANNDLKIQLRRERTEERRKMFQLADTQRRVGSSAIDTTPFARWKKALPALSKSIDSDDRKTTSATDTKEPIKSVKKRGGFFAKIVGLAIDKKTNSETPRDSTLSPNNLEGETDTNFHESLPEELLKIKDITVNKSTDQKKKSNVEFKSIEGLKRGSEEKEIKLKLIDYVEKKDLLEKINQSLSKSKRSKANSLEENDKLTRKLSKKQTSDTSNQSKQSDSIGSVIPVITISTTESDDEILQTSNVTEKHRVKQEATVAPIELTKPHTKTTNRSNSDSKSLQRQNSVDSINETKRERKPDEGHKFQFSL